MIVFLADEQDEPVKPEPLRTLAELVLKEEKLPAATEVSVVLVDEAQMTRYNTAFMGREGPTDVLALPLENLRPGRAPVPRPTGPPLNLGDVFICPTVVERQATEAGVAFDRELALMVVHGILHLLGYDHVDDADAESMESRERELLAMAGLAQ